MKKNTYSFLYLGAALLSSSSYGLSLHCQDVSNFTEGTSSYNNAVKSNTAAFKKALNDSAGNTITLNETCVIDDIDTRDTTTKNFYVNAEDGSLIYPKLNSLESISISSVTGAVIKANTLWLKANTNISLTGLQIIGRNNSEKTLVRLEGAGYLSLTKNIFRRSPVDMLSIWNFSDGIIDDNDITYSGNMGKEKGLSHDGTYRPSGTAIAIIDTKRLSITKKSFIFCSWWYFNPSQYRI